MAIERIHPSEIRAEIGKDFDISNMSKLEKHLKRRLTSALKTLLTIKRGIDQPRLLSELPDTRKLLDFRVTEKPKIANVIRAGNACAALLMETSMRCPICGSGVQSKNQYAKYCRTCGHCPGSEALSDRR